jgi:hypothetical protein
MLAASSVAVYLGGAQEVMALRELDVVGAVAVVRKRPRAECRRKREAGASAAISHIRLTRIHAGADP